jgi:hypothetical protein
MLQLNYDINVSAAKRVGNKKWHINSGKNA